LSASPSAPPALVSRPARGLRPHRQRKETPEEEPSSTSPGASILHVWALGGAGPDGGRTYQYWPFSSSETCITGKPRILLFLRTLETRLICSSPFCILKVPPGMTVSSSLRLCSPLKNGSGFSLKPERMSPVTMDDQTPCQT
jgi:hypothetical protein